VPGGDDGYEYLLSMRDEMSAQSKAITGALNSMTSALERSDRATRAHGEAHRESARAVKEHEGVLKGFISTLARGAVGGGIGGGLVGDIAKGTLIAHGVERMAELAGEGIRFAVEASEFKENALAAYTVVRGTADEGERTFAELDKAAREIHMPAERAHEIAQRLMLEGLESQKAVTDTVRAVGDLQRVGLEAGASKIQAIVERSVAAGHFDIGKGARGLKGTGATFDTIAAELGMGRKQFEAELKAGRISAEAGIEAIDQVVLKGKVGALATKKFTISDALVDMKNNIRGVLQETDSGPIVDAFRRMSEQFTETGDGAKDTKEAINALIDLGGGLVDLATGIGTTLVSAINALKGALKGARDMAGGLLDFLKDIAHAGFHTPEGDRFHEQAERDVDKRVDKQLRQRIERAKVDMVLDFQKEPGHAAAETHALGKKLGIELYAPDKEEGPPKPTPAKPATAAAHPAAAPPSMLDQLDASNEAAMHALGKDAAEAHHEGAREGYHAHSPSRKMFDVGIDAAEGMISGAQAASKLSGRDTAIQDTGRAMSGGKRVDVHVDFGGFHVHGAIDADDFMPLLESQVADVFERVAIELGS
jgi:hypothetical protein